MPLTKLSRLHTVGTNPTLDSFEACGRDTTCLEILYWQGFDAVASRDQGLSKNELLQVGSEAHFGLPRMPQSGLAGMCFSTNVSTVYRTIANGTIAINEMMRLQ